MYSCCKKNGADNTRTNNDIITNLLTRMLCKIFEAVAISMDRRNARGSGRRFNLRAAHQNGLKEEPRRAGNFGNSLLSAQSVLRRIETT
jgi:hypothetical protein